MNNIRADYDSPWKEIIERYFPEFIAYYFPHADGEIDWGEGYAFLDKELQRVVRAAKVGRRHVDKLVKVVQRADGAEAWVLVHIEVQGEPEDDFPERMYTYNYRLFDRYQRRIASLAVLTDANKSWRPQRFGYELFGCRVALDFPIAKLLDYGADWEALEADNNLFALVTMAHLQTQATRHKPGDRYRAKLRLAKLFYQKGYDRQDILELFRFIDWVMTLPPELEKQFMNDVVTYEAQERKPYVATFERIATQRGIQQGIKQGVEQGIEQGVEQGIEQGVAQGIEQGVAQGIEQGVEQGMHELLLMTLEIRFGPISASLKTRLETVTDTEQLKTLHYQALQAESLDEFTRYLQH